MHLQANSMIEMHKHKTTIKNLKTLSKQFKDKYIATDGVVADKIKQIEELESKVNNLKEEMAVVKKDLEESNSLVADLLQVG